MKRRRHTPDQFTVRLRETDGLLATGVAIAQVLQKIDVSDQTLHPLAQPVRRHEGRRGQVRLPRAVPNAYTGSESIASKV